MEMNVFLSLFIVTVILLAGLLLIGAWIYKKIEAAKKIEVQGNSNVKIESPVSMTPVSNLQWRNPADLNAYAMQQYAEKGIEKLSTYFNEDCSCAFAPFYGLIHARFNEMKQIGKSEDISGEKVYLAYTLTNFVNGKELTSFLRLVKGSLSAKNYKPSESVPNKNMIEKFKYKNEHGEDVIDVIEEIQFIFPDPTKQFSIKKESIITAIKETEIEWKEFREEEEATVYTLVNNRFTGWSLKPTTLQGWGLTNSELLSNYRDNIEIYRMKQWHPAIEISKLLEVFIQTVKSGHSLGLIGMPGSGKSKLMEHLVATLGAQIDTRIVLATLPTLEKILSEDSTILNQFTEDKKNILVIEEAYDLVTKEPELFKTITDSFISKKANIGLIFTCNLTEKEIEEATQNGVFRSGRTLVVRVNPLQRDNAFGVAERLNTEKKPDTIFQMDRYKEEIGREEQQMLCDIYEYNKDRKTAELERIIDSVTSVTEGEVSMEVKPVAVLPKQKNKPIITVDSNRLQRSR